MKFRLLKTKLEHEIEQHFEDDAYNYVTNKQIEFDLYFEIVEHGNTYIIEVKYQYKNLTCCQFVNGKMLPIDLVIVGVNNNPNKTELITILDEIADKEQRKQDDRNRDNNIINRLNERYDKK